MEHEDRIQKLRDRIHKKMKKSRIQETRTKKDKGERGKDKGQTL